VCNFYYYIQNKKDMKKIFIPLLFLLMLDFGFTACGAKNSSRVEVSELDSNLVRHVKIKEDSARNPKYRINPKALELNKKAVDLYMKSMGTNKDSLRKVIALHEEALRIDSNFSEAYKNLVDYRVQLKDFKGALSIIDKAERRFSDDPSFPTMKGKIYDGQGNTRQANIEYKHAIKLYDQILKRGVDVMAYSNRAYLLSIVNKDNSAEKLLRKACSSNIYTVAEKNILKNFLFFASHKPNNPREPFGVVVDSTVTRR
jgi:tetratricopeptide (TPR) repeat protein